MAAAAAAAPGAQTPAQRLLDASARGDAAAVEALLGAGVHPNVAAADAHGGLHPLHLAAREGHTSIVELLLQNGVDVNAATASGRTALHYAAQRGRVEVARLLLDRGANVKAETAAEPDEDDFGSCQPLHLAAYHGHAAVVELLLQRGADANAEAFAAWYWDSAGLTPLHFAVATLGGWSAEEQSLVVARVLLDAGALIDAADSNGWQALHFAAYDGSLELVQYLLDRGADVNAATLEGDTALYISAHDDSLELPRLLLDRGADVNAATAGGCTALHVAAYYGRLELARLLLDRGANINAAAAWEPADYDDDHFASSQPLHLAVHWGRTPVVELLLSRGADVRATAAWDRHNEMTPLHLAVREASKKAAGPMLVLARALLDAGAPVDAINGDGLAALHVAVERGCLELARLLLDCGADVNQKSVYDPFSSWQPLHVAAYYHHTAIVELLLSRGADVRATAKSYISSWMAPLDCAVAEGDDSAPALAVVRALLDAGTPVNSADSDGPHALHSAARRGTHKTAALLLARGADVNAANWNGETALHLAAADLNRRGAADVVRQLIQHGADMCAVDRSGRTPLHIVCAAKDAGTPKLLEWMLELAAERHAADLCSGVQHAVVGMAAEAARLQQERVAWEQERAALEAARVVAGSGALPHCEAPAAKRARAG